MPTTPPPARATFLPTALIPLAALAGLLASCSAPHSHLAAATPDQAWDAAFTRTSGWNGGDIAHSIDLGDMRTLWLFGDSIFGPVIDSRRQGDHSRMLRAGIAWHTTPPPGLAPAAITFAGPEPFADLPAAPWAAPPPDLFPSGSWYWLMNDAVRRPPPLDDLILFTTAIGPSGNPDGMWNFRRLGGVVITIANPAAPPSQWRALHTPNPLVTATPAHNQPQHDSDNAAVAAVQFPSRSGHYVLFGVHERSSSDKTLTAHTCPASTLTDPARWTPVPHPTLAGGEPVVVADEFTVHALDLDGREVLVLITSGPFGSRTIIAHTALAPAGPWSAGTVVYTAPDPGPGGMVYAAKGHAHLSRPGELLVSYVVNADLGRVFGDASLYRPRFVRVPLPMLPKPPQPRTQP